MKPITERANMVQLFALIIIGIPALLLWILGCRLTLVALKVAQWASPELAGRLLGEMVKGFEKRWKAVA